MTHAAAESSNDRRDIAEQLCGAGYDVKSGERTNSRNGYRDRLWDTRVGAIELKIPNFDPAATSRRFWSRAAPQSKHRRR
jgi:transposase-like protein